MNPRDLCTKLNELLADGLSEGVFVAIQPHLLIGSQSGESLAPSQPIGMIGTGASGVTFADYIQLLENARYSIVLADYSLVTIECFFETRRLVKHRYGYIPCPVVPVLAQGRPEDTAVADWLKEVVAAWGLDALLSLGTYRFDYAPKQKAQGHPASHFTFASADCRIPVRAPMGISDFLNFIFDNFFRQHLSFWRKFSPFLTCAGVEDTIEVDEMVRHHISWEIEQ